MRAGVPLLLRHQRRKTRSFSVELALKALCVKRGITYPKTHNLAELFAVLPPTDRNTAMTGYRKKNPASKTSLEDVLKVNAHAFEEWRYHHEYLPKTVAYDEMAHAFDEIYALSN
jgi:HEPN domain-containing protein